MKSEIVEMKVENAALRENNIKLLVDNYKLREGKKVIRSEDTHLPETIETSVAPKREKEMVIEEIVEEYPYEHEVVYDEDDSQSQSRKVSIANESMYDESEYPIEAYEEEEDIQDEDDWSPPSKKKAKKPGKTKSEPSESGQYTDLVDLNESEMAAYYDCFANSKEMLDRIRGNSETGGKGIKVKGQESR